MFGILNPLGSGRGTGVLVISVVFFALQILFFGFIADGAGSGFFGGGKEVDALKRPALTSHLPASTLGWHKRSYLVSDGEAITQGARGGGIEARLAIGEDLEQFQLYSKAGISAATALYVNGDQRIALAIKRGIMKVPPWVNQRPSLTNDGLEMVRRVRNGSLAAIVHGVPFERRDVSGPNGGGIGYDRYVARLGQDLRIDVISNAPRGDVEDLLARVDVAALKVQAAEDNPEINAAYGVVLHHRPETWPETWPETRPDPVGETAK